MADITASNLFGKKITETYKGLLHFDSALGVGEKPVYDGAGTKTALSLGPDSDKVLINGNLQVSNDLSVLNDTNLDGSVSIGENLSIEGNINLNNGGTINDITINPSGNSITTRVLNTCEVGKIRIRESSTDFELIFGNPTEPTPNLFSIIVKKGNTNNLYIKNNYSDPDINSPLWINRSTGEVNIKMLNVGGFRNDIKVDGNQSNTGGSNTTNIGGGLYPTGGIMMFPVAGIPKGWLECNGIDISINDYKVLYDVIGHNYTTSGSLDRNSRFQIPDMRGLFVRGWDNGKGVDSGRSLGSRQEDLLKNHTHSIDLVRGYLQSNANTNTPEGVWGSGTTGSVDGGLGGSETRPKNIALIYCIKT